LEETEQDHRHFEEAAPVYATGGLEPEERQAFEAHLETGCTICFDLLKELQPTSQFEPENPDLVHSETLKNIPEDNPPPEDFSLSDDYPRRRQVAARNSSSSGVLPKLRTILTSGVLAVLLVLIAGGSLWFAITGRTDVSDLVEERQLLELDVKDLNQRMKRLQDEIKEQAKLVNEIRELQEKRTAEPTNSGREPSGLSPNVRQLKAKLAEKEKENASLLREVTNMSKYEAFIQSSRLHLIPFVGKRSRPAKGFLFYDPTTNNAMFFASGLPPLPPRAAYHLWALIRKPIRLGTFTLDEGKNGRLWLHDIVTLIPGTKFAVSVEQGAVRAKPTGEIYLLGEMKPVTS